VLFPDIWEYPILLVGALAALAVMRRGAPSGGSLAGGSLPGGSLPAGSRPGFDFGSFLVGWAARVIPFVLAAAALVAALVVTTSPFVETAVWLVIGGLLLLFGGRNVVLVGGTAVVLLVASLAPTFTAQFRARSFFGVTEVRHSDGIAVLMNGTIVHGTQWLDASRRRVPTTYYGAAGPAGDLFEVGADSSAVDPKAIGIVGLGAGTLAAYKDEWMTMTYFEIDPVVIRAATDPALFTYLADAPGAPEIVEGDARLSLASEPDGRYDLLVMDAFSSDAIPIHLLTLEAVTDELRTVTPDGVIGFHISNRYYQLAPAIAAALADLGLQTMERASSPADLGGDESQLPSRWVAASRDPARIAALRARGWTNTIPAARPFTDDYADLLSTIRLGP
jgi:hypothetical protein